jgi:hypothetical protein
MEEKDPEKKWTRRDTLKTTAMGAVGVGLATTAYYCAPRRDRNRPQPPKEKPESVSIAAYIAEAKNGQLSEKLKARIKIYFTDYKIGGTDNPAYAPFIKAVDDAKTTMDYIQLREQWYKIVRADDHVPLPELQTEPELEMWGTDQNTPQPRLSRAILRDQIHSRVIAGEEFANRQALQADPDAYFESLDAWLATFEPKLPAYVAAKKANFVPFLVPSEAIDTVKREREHTLEDLQRTGLRGTLKQVRWAYEHNDTDVLNLQLDNLRSITDEMSATSVETRGFQRERTLQPDQEALASSKLKALIGLARERSPAR